MRTSRISTRNPGHRIRVAVKRGYLFAFAVVLVSLMLGATVLRDPIANAATPFTNVIVGNTSTNPVPVQQQGTADVNVTNSSVPVTVQNAPPAEEPYQMTLACSLDQTEICSSLAETVPTGKRLVIQTISAEGVTDPGVTISMFRLQISHDQLFGYYVLLGKQVDTTIVSSTSAADARSVTIYADPGTSLGIFAQASGASTLATHPRATIDLAGYLVPAS